AKRYEGRDLGKRESRPSQNRKRLSEIKLNLDSLQKCDRLTAFHGGFESQLISSLNSLLVQSVRKPTSNRHFLNRAVWADQHSRKHYALNLILTRFFRVARLRAVER